MILLVRNKINVFSCNGLYKSIELIQEIANMENLSKSKRMSQISTKIGEDLLPSFTDVHKRILKILGKDESLVFKITSEHYI